MPAPHSTTCPHCNKSLRIEDRKLGVTVRCPGCGQQFVANTVGECSLSPTDSSESVVSVDTTNLANDSTDNIISGPAAQSMEEPTLRRLGRFELKSVLGAGGFGKVYRAYDPQLERFVALKVPTFGPNQKTRIQRFLAEAKAAARLKHANIVSTFESGKADKKYYIASEYIEGELLSQRIKKSPLTIRESVGLVGKLADALAYAHSQHIVHRDIKPHNVMVDADGEPQLMDFGLAKRLDDDAKMTTDGALLGTPAYMSPEQARGELSNVGAASDQYSLGVVLYHLLTGSTPCTGSPHMVIAEVAKGEYHSPRDVKAEVDSDIDAICQRALAPQPTQRYQSCSEFSDDLKAWLDGRPVSARPLSLFQKVKRVAVTNVVNSLFFAVILLLAFLSAMLAWEVMNKGNDVSTSSVEVNIKSSETEQLAPPGDRHVDNSPRVTNPASDPEPSPPPNPVAAATPSLPLAATTVDLLELVDVKTGSVRGTWIQDRILESPNEQWARIQIPYAPKGDYDVVWDIEPLEPVQGIAIGLVNQFSSFNVLIGYGDNDFLLESVPGGKTSPAVEFPGVVAANRRTRITCKVRSDRVAIVADGKEIFTWEGDTNRISQVSQWRMPIRSGLYLGCNETKCRFHGGQLRELSSEGTELIPPRPDLTSPQATQFFGDALPAVLELANQNDWHLSIHGYTSEEPCLRIGPRPQSPAVTETDLLTIAKLKGPVFLALVGDEITEKASDPSVFLALARMPQLRMLDLRNQTFFDRSHSLAMIQCQSLSFLDLSYQEMSMSEISDICRLKSLKYLLLKGCGLNAPKIELITRELVELERLELNSQQGENSMTDASVQELKMLRNLIHLDLGGCLGITDDSVTVLSEMQQLHRLGISGTAISSDGAAAIRSALPKTNVVWTPYSVLDDPAFAEVRSLVVAAGGRMVILESEHPGGELRIHAVIGKSVSDELLNAIARLQTPVQLDLNGLLRNEPWSIEAFESLGKIELTELHLAKLENQDLPDIGDEHLKGLSRSTSLVELSLGDHQLQDQSILHICKIKSLRVLWLNGSGVGDAAVSAIATGLPELRRIYLECRRDPGRLTNEAVRSLRRLKNLESLSLSGCSQLTDECISDLSSMTSLRWLGISGTSITAKAADQLRKALPDTTIRSDGPSKDTSTVSPRIVPPGRPANSELDVAVGKSDASLILTTWIRRDELGDVRVTLLDKEGNELDTVSTDSRGRGIFRNLRPGDYQFVCRSDYSGPDVAQKHRLRDLHRPTSGTVTVTQSQTTRHRVSLLPLRTVSVEYAEVVPSGDLITLTAGDTRKGDISEAVTASCHFPLTGMQNRTQSAIRIESSNGNQALQMRCLPSGQITDLGTVSFHKASATNDDWSKTAGGKEAAVVSDHVYLIRHQDGRRFKLRVSRVN